MWSSGVNSEDRNPAVELVREAKGWVLNLIRAKLKSSSQDSLLQCLEQLDFCLPAQRADEEKKYFLQFTDNLESQPTLKENLQFLVQLYKELAFLPILTFNKTKITRARVAQAAHEQIMGCAKKCCSGQETLLREWGSNTSRLSEQLRKKADELGTKIGVSLPTTVIKVSIPGGAAKLFIPPLPDPLLHQKLGGGGVSPWQPRKKKPRLVRLDPPKPRLLPSSLDQQTQSNPFVGMGTLVPPGNPAVDPRSSRLSAAQPRDDGSAFRSTIGISLPEQVSSPPPIADSTSAPPPIPILSIFSEGTKALPLPSLPLQPIRAAPPVREEPAEDELFSQLYSAASQQPVPAILDYQGLRNPNATLAKYKEAGQEYSAHLVAALWDELGVCLKALPTHPLFVRDLHPRDNTPKQVALALILAYRWEPEGSPIEQYAINQARTERKRDALDNHIKDISKQLKRPLFLLVWEKHKILSRLNAAATVERFHTILSNERNRRILTTRRDSRLMHYVKLCGWVVASILGLPLGLVGGYYLAKFCLFGARETHGRMFIGEINQQTREGKNRKQLV